VAYSALYLSINSESRKIAPRYLDKRKENSRHTWHSGEVAHMISCEWEQLGFFSTPRNDVPKCFFLHDLLVPDRLGPLTLFGLKDIGFEIVFADPNFGESSSC
jgi:hypothetical protein